MFRQRLFSGIVLLIITVLTLYFGGTVTFGVMALVSFIGIFEIQRVFRHEKTILGIMGYVGTAVYYALLYLDEPDYILPFVILFLMLLMAVYVFTFPTYQIADVMAVFFGLIYTSVMLSFIYRLRILPKGGLLVILIFLSAWGNDTLAYCVGMLFGKHKMSPKLSPKKSIEGAVGGIVGAAILGLLFGLFVNLRNEFPYNPALLYPIVCGCGAVISIIGDLAASAIKRNHNIKDYGTLIPGHGGILDRFDSIIFTAPVVYYLMMFLTKGIL